MTSSANLYSANNSGDEDDLPNAALAAPISVVNGETHDAKLNVVSKRLSQTLHPHILCQVTKIPR